MQAKAILKDKDIFGIVTKVANGIPQQATFFMTFVMINVRPMQPDIVPPKLLPITAGSGWVITDWPETQGRH